MNLSTAPLTPSGRFEGGIEPVTDPELIVSGWIRRLARWLPEQRPLSVFVHTNPFEAFEGHHFYAVCEAATRIRRCRTTLTPAEYRRLLAQRQIRAEDVAAALRRVERIGASRVDELPLPPAGTILLSRVRREMAVEAGEMADAFLLRVLPAFLDLGSAIWPMPGRERGLLNTIRWLARAPLGAPEPWLSGLHERLGGDASPLSLIVSCLRERGDPETGWPAILHEAMFALSGYAGMIHRLEHVVDERPPGVAVSLVDYVAVRLVVEELALLDVSRHLFGRRADLVTLARSLESYVRGADDSAEDHPAWTPEQGAFQDALEEEYLRSFIGGIAMKQELGESRPERVEVQVVVCIDERSESLRRHLEECVDHCETFGVAGFFGVPFKHRPPLSRDEGASCPAALTPTRRVTETLTQREEVALRRARWWQRLIDVTLGDDASRSLLRGVVASLGNAVHVPRALLQMLLPQLFVRPARDFERSQLRYADHVEPEGFSLDEQVAMVEGTLRTLGLAQGFARWVLVVGHGSQAVNNPFVSGYQCGACGGKRGGINARVFCAFANDPAVREQLRARGIEVPEETRFVPGEHDTALDHLRWFDLDALRPEERLELEGVRAQIDLALQRNAKERARRFADIPLDEPLDATVARVRARCADYAETRPEYNHATNAACVIGRRGLTRGLFLDRRAFLVSYDPTTDDSQAKTLEKVLAAPLPVCAGINLEYFFSTMDPLGFGCGTKLPHNVVGLLGVTLGADGDLRPGLWSQTTEIHEPVRLVTLVEAEPETITKVLNRLPAVRNLAVNAWIHLFALSPSRGSFFRWVGEGFEPYVPSPQLPFRFETSLEACGHTRENVPPCLIQSTPTVREGASAPEAGS